VRATFGPLNGALPSWTINVLFHGVVRFGAVTLLNAWSNSTTPPRGALLQLPEGGLATVTTEVFCTPPYEAVIVLAPAAIPVIGSSALVCPAETAAVAGTVTLVGSLLDAVTAAALRGADDNVTVKESTPPTASAIVAGLSVLSAGGAGVEPSVVN
jgi:hypothetical protein